MARKETSGFVIATIVQHRDQIHCASLSATGNRDLTDNITISDVFMGHHVSA